MLCLLLLVSAKVLRDKDLEAGPRSLVEISASGEVAEALAPNEVLMSTCPQEQWREDGFPKEKAGEAVKLWVKVFGGAAPVWLEEYAEKCLDGYVAAPYHHRGHAVDVYRYWMQAFGKTKEMKENDIKAVAVALLCHDYGHPGLNNKYMAENKFKGVEDSRTARLTDSIKRAINAINSAESSKWDDWLKSSRRAEGKGPEEMSDEQVAQRASGGSFAVFIPGETDMRGACAPGDSGSAADRVDEKVKGPFCMKGCYGGERGETGCWSIEESFHAMNAKKLFEAAAKGSAADGVDSAAVASAVLATDMGRDASDRDELLDIASKAVTDPQGHSEQLRGILIHLTDISGASSDAPLCWSASIHAEFRDQASLIDGSQPNAPDVQSWLGVELGWARSVKAFVEKAFEMTTEDEEGEKFQDARLAAVNQHVAKLESCMKTFEDETKTKTKREGVDFPDLGTDPLQMQIAIMETITKHCPEFAQ